MLKLAINGYTEDQVKKALKSNREIKFEYDLLDKNDKKMGTIVEISGSYSFSSNAEIKGCASFALNEKYTKEIDFLSERIKPYYCLRMGNEWVKWGQGIYLLSSPNRKELDGGIYRDVEAYDKTLILKEDMTDNRYFIASGKIGRAHV